MAIEIVMPQLNLSMDSGKVANWVKQDGEKINPGDIMLEVESDKATVEVESVNSGILKIIMGADNGDIPVGTVIAYLRGENEAPITKPSPVLAAAVSVAAVAGPVQQGLPVAAPLQMRRLPSSPAARRKAAELKIDWQLAVGTGRTGRIKERDILLMFEQQAQSRPSMPSTDQILPVAVSLQLTPLAKRVVDDFGLDEAVLARLNPGKIKIEREDVETSLRTIVREHQSLSAARAAAPLSATPRREAMGAVRKRIAERMDLSQRTYAPVTLTTEADATEFVQVRETLKADPRAGVVPSYNALLTKICARALMEHPELNASLDGNEIVTWPMINIGLAVSTERGLVVPVVRDVAAKTLSELVTALNELLERAAKGKATAEELTGGTFTITNLGVYEIDAFTPIINPPECAVLGVGRLRKQMVVVNDQPAIRTMLALSLTFDHRLVDGAPAAAFLQRIKHLIEQPYLWVL